MSHPWVMQMLERFHGIFAPLDEGRIQHIALKFSSYKA